MNSYIIKELLKSVFTVLKAKFTALDFSKVLLIIISFALGFGLCYYIYGSRQEIITVVQGEPTSEIVTEVAKTADVTISAAQAKEIVKEVKKVSTSSPVKTVTTTGKNLAATVKAEEKKADADFSFLKTTDEDLYTLNQYNVKAYKKNLFSASYHPRTDNFKKVGVLGVTYQHRINKNGLYAGVSLERNFQFNKNYIGVVVTY